MNTTKPCFVVRIAGAGDYFENGYNVSSHGTREDAEKAREKLLTDYASRSAKKHPPTRVEFYPELID